MICVCDLPSLHTNSTSKLQENLFGNQYYNESIEKYYINHDLLKYASFLNKLDNAVYYLNLDIQNDINFFINNKKNFSKIIFYQSHTSNINFLENISVKYDIFTHNTLNKIQQNIKYDYNVLNFPNNRFQELSINSNIWYQSIPINFTNYKDFEIQLDQFTNLFPIDDSYNHRTFYFDFVADNKEDLDMIFDTLLLKDSNHKKSYNNLRWDFHINYNIINNKKIENMLNHFHGRDVYIYVNIKNEYLLNNKKHETIKLLNFVLTQKTQINNKFNNLNNTIKYFRYKPIFCFVLEKNSNDLVSEFVKNKKLDNFYYRLYFNEKL